MVCESRKAKGAGFHRMGVQSKEGFTFQPEEALIQVNRRRIRCFMIFMKEHKISNVLLGLTSNSCAVFLHNFVLHTVRFMTCIL